ncbi:MAG: hypothetical protein M1552_08695 [Firmicutes bacterium]|nr:hypothetical protein [Bacillota bacterium]MCL5994215.1 hypothetical protein [Bacillota bacterium]
MKIRGGRAFFRRQNKSLVLGNFIREIESQSLGLEEFDEKLWRVAIEKAKVMPDGRLVFRFKDETEMARK